MIKNKLLIDGQQALYSPLLAQKVGRSAATILQQAYYWMSVRGGKTIDGIKWFWKTYEQWAEELSLSISTVRRAIAKLKSLGLLEIEKISAKTHYQANWYTIKIESIKLFLGEQMDMLKMDTSICSKWADNIKESSSENLSLQDVVEEKNFEEVDWNAVAKKIDTWEQQQTELNQEASPQQPQEPHYAHEIEKTDSLSQTDPNEGRFSASQDETISNLGKPTNQQIADACNELRRLRLNPDACMGAIRTYWANVPGAIAYLKEALKTWKKVDKPFGVFLDACKNGKKPEKFLAHNVTRWIEWAMRKRIIAGTSDGIAYTHDDKAVPLHEMMRLYPCTE